MKGVSFCDQVKKEQRHLQIFSHKKDCSARFENLRGLILVQHAGNCVKKKNYNMFHMKHKGNSMDILDWVLVVFLVLVCVGGSIWFLYYAYNQDSKKGDS